MIKFIESPGVQCKACYVYWVRRSIHSDIKTEGYVGITDDIDRRFKQHRDSVDLVNYTSVITEALREHDDIVFDIVETCNDREDAKAMERSLRPEYRIGWNVAKGGGGRVDYDFSEEHRKNLCIAASNKPPVTKETRKKMSESSPKTKSAEHRRKIGEANKRRVYSDEMKEKLCKAFSKPINVDGVVYPSRKAAFEAIGGGKVLKMMKAGTAKYL